MNKSFEILWIPTSVSSSKKLQTGACGLHNTVYYFTRAVFGNRVGLMAGESGVFHRAAYLWSSRNRNTFNKGKHILAPRISLTLT